MRLGVRKPSLSGSAQLIEAGSCEGLTQIPKAKAVRARRQPSIGEMDSTAAMATATAMSVASNAAVFICTDHTSKLVLVKSHGYLHKIIHKQMSTPSQTKNLLN
jgi:hypothetical protein